MLQIFVLFSFLYSSPISSPLFPSSNLLFPPFASLLQMTMMAVQMMQELEQDKDIVSENSSKTSDEITLYFKEIRKALDRREKAVLATVRKYTSIKLTVLDVRHQKLQEDRKAITKAINSLQLMLYQTELDPSLLMRSQALSEELEEHHQSVLSMKDTMNQNKISSTTLSFSGDLALSQPLKDAGALNECQKKPDSNIISMQRVVVSEEEDPYLCVPSRFDDLGSKGPQEELRIDANVSSMLNDEDVEYHVPRKWVPSDEVPPLPPHRLPVPPHRKSQPFVAVGQSSAIQSSPDNLATDMYDVPKRIMQQDMYDVPKRIMQQDMYDVPKRIMQQNRFQQQVSTEVLYCVPRPSRVSDSNNQFSNEHSIYDVPTPRSLSESGIHTLRPYRVSDSNNQFSNGHNIYDVPGGSLPESGIYDRPRPQTQRSPSLPSSETPQLNHLPGTKATSPTSPPPPRPPKSSAVIAMLEKCIPTDPTSSVPQPGRRKLPSPPSEDALDDSAVSDVSGSATLSTRKPPPLTQCKPKKEVRSKPIPMPRTNKPGTPTAYSNVVPWSPSPNEVSHSLSPTFNFNITQTNAPKCTKGSTLPAKISSFSYYQDWKPAAILTSDQLSQPFGTEKVYPRGICCSPVDDMLIVTDVYNHCIRLINPSTGQVIERIGTAGRAGGQFKEPSAVVMDNQEYIFVAEHDNPRVQKFTSRGKYLLKFGQKAFWGTQLHDPWGLALSPDDKIYISDWDKGRISVYQKDGKKVKTFGRKDDGLKFPAGIAFDRKGNLLIADRGKHCVWVMTPEGTLIGRIGKKGSGPGELLFPHGVAVLPNNTIAISETGNHRISVFTPTNTFLYSFGEEGIEPGMFQLPRHLCTNSKGQLIVADEMNQRIQIFDVPS